MDKKITLLDCTLRDGGYINDWRWGFDRARSIISLSARAGIEIVEVGFLRNTESEDPDITVFNSIESLNRLIPSDHEGETVFSAMAMCSNYDLDKLSDYSGEGIELIRITAHDYDLDKGLDYAEAVMKKGYKVSINPINIMGYNDRQLLDITDRVNEIHPFQFTVVDTFGSMKRRDLDRIISLVDNNLEKDITLGLHLHENMSLGCTLSQAYVDKHLDRNISVDGSLMGMGRIPGNLPIELIADYLNDYSGKNYDIDKLMDAIFDYISPLKGKTNWGYVPEYYLSARHNVHRNYAEYLISRGDLTNRDMNSILSRIVRSKATAYDIEYITKLYDDYRRNEIDDRSAIESLKSGFMGKKVLVIGPGKTIIDEKQKIEKYIEENDVVTVSVNFTPAGFKIDYIFCSNNKRYHSLVDHGKKCIITSNIINGTGDFVLDYNKLSGSFEQGCNSYIMLLKLLKILGAAHIVVAGMDGYSLNGENYYQSNMRSYEEHGNRFNLAVKEAIRKLEMKPEYITTSEYSNE